MVFLTSYKKSIEYLLTSRCLRFLLKNSLALFFTFLIFFIGTALLIATMAIEYYVLGIHIFDFNSLNTLLHTNFWDHTFHIISILGVIFIAVFNTVFLKCSLTFIVIESINGITPSPLKALYVPLKHISEIFRLSLIIVCGYPEYWLYLIDPVSHTKRAKFFLENSFEEEYDKYTHPYGILFFPLFVQHKWHVIDTLQESEKILREQFGNNLRYNFSYTKIRMIGSSILITSSFFIFHFGMKLDVFPTLIIGGYTSGVFFYYIGIIKLIFDVAIYHYCKSNNSSLFTTNEIKNILLSD